MKASHEVVRSAGRMVAPGITGRGVEEGVPPEEYGWRRLLQKWRRWVIALTVGHGLLHPGNHQWIRDHTSLGSPIRTGGRELRPSPSRRCGRGYGGGSGRALGGGGAPRLLGAFPQRSQAGRVRDEEREAFTKDALSRCYDHLMSTAGIWVETYWLGTDAPFATERRR